MNKKVVLGIAIGVGIITGVGSLVIGSALRLRKAKAFRDEALDAYEDGVDKLREANEILEWAGEIAHDGYMMARGEFDFGEDDFDDDDSEPDNIIRLPKGGK